MHTRARHLCDLTPVSRNVVTLLSTLTIEFRFRHLSFLRTVIKRIQQSSHCYLHTNVYVRREGVGRAMRARANVEYTVARFSLITRASSSKGLGRETGGHLKRRLPSRQHSEGALGREE